MFNIVPGEAKTYLSVDRPNTFGVNSLNDFQAPEIS